MSKRTLSSVSLVLLMVLSTMTPLVAFASASNEIHLSLSSSHVMVNPGYSTNVTLDITNNESTIHDYVISLDNSTFSSAWEIIPSPYLVEDIFPTWSKNATIVIRLDSSATPSDNGQVDLVVTKNGTTVSDTITLYLSVNPVYSPRIEAQAIGDNGLLKIMPGQSIDVQVPIFNDGSVTDTILLDVGSEPDLAAFWANWTSGQNSSGNSSGNNSGNNSGDSGNQSNNTGGNGTGNGTGDTGNQTGNMNNTTSSLSSVLMFGNSYTQSNSLDSLVQNLINSAGGNVSVSAMTGGGMRLPQHYGNVNTSGNQWNTTLSNSDWDYVVLQDQSQVPSFPRTDTYWIDSKDAAISLADRIDDEGSDVVLLMTWGRRAGDAQNPVRNPDFPTMQANLESGYLDFQDNMTSNTNASVWMAPVGLAWESVYDSVVADNATPTLPGNTFYNLYTSDGSHPSLSGSYLTACVLYSTLTGMSPVGINDSTNLNSTLKLELQQHAADTVLNNTQSIAYPWQSNSSGGTNGSSSSQPASFSLMSSQTSSIPSSWEVRWLDDTVENLAAGASDQKTLRITIPNGTNPGFTGVRLYSASVNGNFSTSSLFVIEVGAEMGLDFEFNDQDNSFIPGQTTDSFLTIENTGTAESTYDWHIESLSAGCAISTSEMMTTLSVTQPYQLPIQVTVNPDMNKNDVCTFEITGTANNDSSLSFTADFDVFIDEEVNYTLSGPQSATLEPEVGLSWNIAFTNHGTETIDAYLSFTELSEISTTLQNNRVQTVQEGQTITWEITSLASSGYSGSGFIQSYWVENANGFNSSFDVDFTIEQQGDLGVIGPSNNRVSLAVDSTGQLSLEFQNSGTRDLNLTSTVSGLPSGVDVNMPEEFMLQVGESMTNLFNFTASNTANVGTTGLEFTFTDGNDAWTFNVDIQIVDSYAVSISSTDNSISAGSITSESISLSVTNLGTSSDTYTVSLSADDALQYFDISLSSTSLSIESKDSAELIVTVRRTGQDIPNDLIAMIQVDSISDDSSSASYSFAVQNASVGVDMTIALGDREASPGESISGTVVVTNTGNTEDTITISIPDSGCNLNEAMTLQAGQSSTAFSFTCSVSENAIAGLTGLTVTSTSALDSSFTYEESISYNVLTSFPESGYGELILSQTEFEIGSDSDITILVTIVNNANTPISGNLDMIGEGADLFIATWTSKLSGQETSAFTIPAKSSAQFELTLITERSVTYDETASLKVVSTISLGESTSTLESESIDYTVIGLNREPSGITLPFGIKLDNAQSITAVSSGWVVSILLFLVVRMLMKSRSRLKLESKLREDFLEEEEEEEIESDLGEGETRLLDSSRVECPSCSSILGVPSGSEPPFRFNCPSCGAKIKVVE